MVAFLFGRRARRFSLTRHPNRHTRGTGKPRILQVGLHLSYFIATPLLQTYLSTSFELFDAFLHEFFVFVHANLQNRKAPEVSPEGVTLSLVYR